MVAPSAAPDDTPVTYGSVSGLRNRSWRITPATASAAPTSEATRTRGMRICQKMALSRSPWTGPAVTRCQSSAERQRDRSEGKRQHKADGEDAGGQEDPRPHACAGELGHAVVDASGWIISASFSRPSARRGPGRAMMLSSIT